MDTTPTHRPKRQEQESASPEVTEVAPGVLRSQLPVFLPGLGHVNCYMLQDDRGVTLVDPGLPGPQSWRALVDRLKRAGYKPRDVHTVVVTHSHPDHFGGAGRFRDSYGADILTHRSFRTWFDPASEEGADPDSEDAPPPMPWGRAMPWREDQTFQPPLGRRLKYTLMRKVARRFMRAPTPTRRVDDAEVVTLGGPRVGLAAHARTHHGSPLPL